MLIAGAASLRRVTGRHALDSGLSEPAEMHVECDYEMRLPVLQERCNLTGSQNLAD